MQPYVVWKLVSIAIIVGSMAGLLWLRRVRNRLCDRAGAARCELGQKQEVYRQNER